jgi:hypothetical protein
MYLDEADKRIRIMAGGLDPNSDPDPDSLTSKLELDRNTADLGFDEGFNRLMAYLCKYHPTEYASILQEDRRRREEAARPGGPLTKPLSEYLDDLGVTEEGMERRRKYRDPDPLTGADEFVVDCVNSYRSLFDPAAVEEEMAKLDAEHETLRVRCLNLTTPLAIEKTNRQMAALEGKMAEIRRYRQDLAEAVGKQWQDLNNLHLAIVEARIAMGGGQGLGDGGGMSERQARKRAEDLRAVIQRIECEFSATGKRGTGWGRKNAEMSWITFYPLVGEEKRYKVELRQPGEFNTTVERLFKKI